MKNNIYFLYFFSVKSCTLRATLKSSSTMLDNLEIITHTFVCRIMSSSNWDSNLGKALPGQGSYGDADDSADAPGGGDAGLGIAHGKVLAGTNGNWEGMVIHDEPEVQLSHVQQEDMEVAESKVDSHTGAAYVAGTVGNSTVRGTGTSTGEYFGSTSSSSNYSVATVGAGTGLKHGPICLNKFGEPETFGNRRAELSAKYFKEEAEAKRSVTKTEIARTDKSVSNMETVSFVGSTRSIQIEPLKTASFVGDAEPDFNRTMHLTDRRIDSNVYPGRSLCSLDFGCLKFCWTSTVKHASHKLQLAGTADKTGLVLEGPLVLVITDGHFPEIYDGLGSGVIVLRVNGGNFEDMKSLIGRVFGRKRKGTDAILPAGSVILIGANDEIRRLSSNLFWQVYLAFEHWCYRFFSAGQRSKTLPFDPPTVQSTAQVAESCLTVLPVFCATGSGELQSRIMAILYWHALYTARFKPHRQIEVEGLFLGLQGHSVDGRVFVTEPALALPPPFFPDTSMHGPVILAEYREQHSRLAPFQAINTAEKLRLTGVMMDRLKKVCPDLPIPPSSSANMGNVCVLKAGMVNPTIKVGISIPGNVVLLGMSNLTDSNKPFAKMVKKLVSDGHARVFSVRLDSPLLDDKDATKAINKLKNLGKVGKGTYVIFDPMANTDPRVKPGRGANIRPFIAGKGEAKAYHLVDSMGSLLKLADKGEYDEVFHHAGRILDYIVSVGASVLSVCPLPRYDRPCCDRPSHGFDSVGSVNPVMTTTDGCSHLNTSLRDAGLYMSRSEIFVRPKVMDNGQAVVIAPQQVFPEAFAGAALLEADNIHWRKKTAENLAVHALAVVRALMEGCTAPGESDIKACVAFANWQMLQLARQDVGRVTVSTGKSRPVCSAQARLSKNRIKKL